MNEVSELLNSESSLAGLAEDSGYPSIRTNLSQKQTAVDNLRPLAFNRSFASKNGCGSARLRVNAGVLLLPAIVDANHNDKPT